MGMHRKVRPSAIVKTDSVDYTKKYGKLGNGILAANETKEVYRTSVHTEYTNLYLNITNDSDDIAVIRIWVSDLHVPSLEDLLEAAVTIKPKQTYARGPITMSKNEKMHMLSDTDNVVYRLMGYDER